MAALDSNLGAVLHNVQFDGIAGGTAFPDAAGRYSDLAINNGSAALVDVGGTIWCEVSDAADLRINGSYDLSFLDGDFTIEIDAYQTISNATNYPILVLKSDSGTELFNLRTYGGSDQVEFYMNTQSTLSVNAGASSFPSGQYKRLAVTRQGSTVRIFVNGSLLGSGVLSGAITGHSRTGKLIINGADGASVDQPNLSRFRRLRICRGARYTASYTSTTEHFGTEGTSIFAPMSTVGTVVADLAASRNWTNNGAANITAGSGRNGGNALYLNGSSQFLTAAADASMTLGGTPFTLEGFIKRDGDPYIANVRLYLKMDSNFNDSSASAQTVTVAGNASISSAQSQFGGASGFFDGTGDYLSIPNTTLSIGSGEWTFECWARPAVSMASGTYRIYNAWDGSTGFLIGVLNNKFFITTNNGVITQTATGTTDILSGSWYHLAVSRNSTGTVKVFVNGVQEASVTVTGSIPTPTSIFIGQSSDGASQWWNGYLDELRMTIGVCRYTGTFTAITKPFEFPDSTFRPIIENWSAGTAGFKMFIDTTDVLIAHVYLSGNLITLTGSTKITHGTYHHVALNRAPGDVFKLYLDGVQEATATQGGTITAPGTSRIGYDGTNYFRGNLDDLRLLKGVSIYDNAFTPTTGDLSQTLSVTGTAGASLLAELTSEGVLHDQYGTAGLSLLAEMTSSGAGGQAVIGSGTGTILEPTSTGQGYFTIKGDGAPTLAELTSSGQVTVGTLGVAGRSKLTQKTSAGEGGIQYSLSKFGRMSHTAVLKIALVASGAPSLQVPYSAGVMTIARTGTGSPSLYSLRSTGQAIRGGAGYGQPSLKALATAGSGAAGRSGEGSPSLTKLIASGVAYGVQEASGAGRFKRLSTRGLVL